MVTASQEMRVSAPASYEFYESPQVVMQPVKKVIAAPQEKSYSYAEVQEMLKLQ